LLEAEISGIDEIFKILDGVQVTIDKMPDKSDGTPTPTYKY
jgi:hypothetical protein